jgi:hypothetical protein
MSDWGSAFAGQDIEYTITLYNNQAEGEANTLNDITIQSIFPTNLEVQGASTDLGSDPTVNGNDVRLTLDSLEAGEAVNITVQTNIKPDVPVGTRLVAQANLDFAELKLPLLSNIVTVLVVEEESRVAALVAEPYPQPATETAVPATEAPMPATETTVPATETAMPATEAPTTIIPVPVAQEPTQTPTATPTASTSAKTTPLPDTSTGVPLTGFVLLGMTMVVRTVRLHRARERI